MRHNESFFLKLGLAYLGFSAFFRYMASGGLSQFYCFAGSGPTAVLTLFYCSCGFTVLNAGLLIAFLARFFFLLKQREPTGASLVMLALLLGCEILNEWAKLTLVALFA